MRSDNVLFTGLPECHRCYVRHMTNEFAFKCRTKFQCKFNSILFNKYFHGCWSGTSDTCWKCSVAWLLNTYRYSNRIRGVLIRRHFIQLVYYLLLSVPSSSLFRCFSSSSFGCLFFLLLLLHDRLQLLRPHNGISRYCKYCFNLE